MAIQFFDVMLSQVLIGKINEQIVLLEAEIAKLKSDKATRAKRSPVRSFLSSIKTLFHHEEFIKIAKVKALQRLKSYVNNDQPEQ